jgi:ParB family chromosome partitioning protein
MTEKPRRLGRGLEALLATRAAAPDRTAPQEQGVRRLPIAAIRPNPYQPRKEFRPEELAELESSLRTSGLIQPVTVRPAAGSADDFELVAGERRLRAATRLGWTEIPAIVRELDDRALLTLALVENLQRADLDPIEEAEGYRRLMDEFGLTQQQVAEAVGKERSTVANILRVLNLPEPVRRMIQQGQLSVGHARPLLALPNDRAMLDLANEIIAHKLNVREVERRVRELAEPAPAPTPYRTTGNAGTAAPMSSRSPEAKRLADVLRKYLQTDVSLVVGSKERGEIRVSFYSPDDLERILDLIVGQSRHDGY